MKAFYKGQWSAGSQTIEVTNPFDGSVIDSVPSVTDAEIDQALDGALAGFQDLKAFSGYDRSGFLRQAAGLVLERIDDLARTISLESGKTLREARSEVKRAVQTLELSAEEAKRISGEVLPFSGSPGCEGKLGLTLRVPCGVVAAITPFNFPLNLVCHKVGPGLAAGNSVIIKPASDTPLTALKLTEILLESGCPPRAIACLTGSGAAVGNALCRDPRVRKISFTGSRDVGEKICRVAGLKRVTMELGSNSPVVVLPDADIQAVTRAIAVSGFANAGQICISAQRIIVDRNVHDQLIEALVPAVEQIRAGNQLSEDSDMGPMIREADADRVQAWIHEANQQGATLVCGGARNGAVMQPTVVDQVVPAMRVAAEELFGPAVAVLTAGNLDEAICLANNSRYGLSASVFTQDLDAALRFARQVDSGNIHINAGPAWRTDLMPYGGLKESGLGKEGPKYAIMEMTETKTVVFHSKP